MSAEKLLFSRSELLESVPVADRIGKAGSLLGRYVAACKAEGGLITPALVGSLLGVSRQRVGQLRASGELTSFEFWGKTFFSCNQVHEMLKARIELIAEKEGVKVEDLEAVFSSCYALVAKKQLKATAKALADEFRK